MERGKLSKRTLLIGFFVFCFLIIAVLSFNGLIFDFNAGKPSSIRVESWGGAPQAALEEYAFKSFTEETGVDVVVGNFIGMDQFTSQVKASYPPGGEFNIGYMSSFANYIKFIQLGYGVELDERKIPNLKHVLPVMLDNLKRLNGGKISAIPYDYGQTGIAYNPKYISKEKAERLGAALMWDKALKGKISSSSDWRPSIWYAALYTGQNPNDIKDIEAVWEALREQKKLVKKYWTSGSDFNNLFASEEVYVSLAYSGRVYSLKEQGYSIAWLPLPNTFSWMEYMFVLKGTDLDTAYKLLNSMLEPKPCIEVAMGQNYPPAIDPTKVEMPEYIQNMTAFDKSGELKGYLFADPYYWANKKKEWSEKWDRIQAGW